MVIDFLDKDEQVRAEAASENEENRRPIQSKVSMFCEEKVGYWLLNGIQYNNFDPSR